MTAAAGERFAGLTAGGARAAVVERAAQAEGGCARASRTATRSPFCTARGERIEPLISLQWFMRDGRAGAPAIEAVRDGRVRIHPKRRSRVYLDWMENIRPWCVSRQLWWGHRLPVWYRARRDLRGPSRARREGDELGRDPDVLDTWFSVRAVAVRDARLAGRHARAARLLPDRRARHRARHPLPLGGADGHDGPRVRRRDPVRRRLHPLGHPGAGRPADVEVARHRRSTRSTRSTSTAPTPSASACSRCRSTQDVRYSAEKIDAGPAARQQAVERVALGAA